MANLKSTKHTPPYDKYKLLDAYIRIVTFQRRVWEASVEMFHKPAAESPLAPRMTRMQVMHIVAPDLFSVLRDVCVLTVDAGIACLLDPEISMNDPTKPNLVLSRVIADLAPPHGTPARAAVDAAYDELKKLADPIRTSRNKVGAHLDLRVALAILNHDDDPAGMTSYPLKPVTVGELERMMELLTRITDEIVAHARPGRSWYEQPISADVNKLFSTLFRGVLKRPGD